MDLCLSVSSYHELFVNKVMNVNQFIRKANEHNITAVELCDLSIEQTDKLYLDQLQTQLLNYDMKLACIAVRNDFSSQYSIQRMENIKHVKKWIKVANYLKVPLIRVWSGKSSASDDAFLRVVECFKLLIPYAKSNNVTMVLENHGGVTLNPDIAVRIIQQVNSPFLMLCPDFGHLMKEDQLNGLIKFSPYIKHVHAKTHNFNNEGEEKNIDYRNLMDILRIIDYKGYLSVEYEGGINHDEGIVKTKELILRYLV